MNLLLLRLPILSECRDSQEGNLLVYDLGGGTFDVSIVHVHDNECTVKFYAGNNALGGSDFDVEVANIILRKFKSRNGDDLLPNPNESTYQNSYRKLLQIAESVKIDLSTTSTASANLNSFIGLNGGSDDDDNKDDEIEVTLEELNDAIRPKILETMKTIDEALSKANLSKSDISKVIRVGGSSRLSIVEEELNKYFNGVRIATGVDVDSCVAEGACRYLYDERFKIHEITAYSLGHLLNDNMVHCVIPANSKIPIELTVTNYTVRDNQPSVTTALYQGHATSTNELTPMNECIKLTDFSFTGFEKGPAGSVGFEITYHIKKSGIVFVTAVEKKTNKPLLSRVAMKYSH